MSVIGNPLLLGGGDAAFTTDRSVRLRSSVSAYFNRTFASGNRQIFTWSGWVKKSAINTIENLLGTPYNTASLNSTLLRIGNDTIQFATWDGGVQTGLVTSANLLRDPSAWYHIVISVNTTQATAANRVRIYVNGVEVAYSSPSYPAQNYNTYINSATTHYSGVLWFSTGGAFAAAQAMDGYLTEVNFIDGQALTPTSFGEYDAVRNTQWKPKAYTGTYGTNGFYLKFADNSAATAAAIGKDSSGNGNNWTPNGISVTAGVTYDSMTDVPTLTSETASNFATLNPTFAGTSGLLGGNLDFGLGSTMIARSSILMTTGKWYAEFTMVAAGVNSCRVGIAGESSTTTTNYLGSDAVSWGYTQINGVVYNNSAAPFTYATYANGDVIGVAYDADARNLSFYKNNTLQGTITSANIAAGNYYFAVQVANSTPIGWSCNFGQRPFAYTPPTGFKSLNTYNLPDPAVASSDDYHKIYSYTGNGGGLQVGEIQKPASLFNLDRSLRLRASSVGYLNRTFGTPTNAKKWTLNLWVKRGAVDTDQEIFSHVSSAQEGRIYFTSANVIRLYEQGTANGDLSTTRVFRDSINWGMLTIVCDTANATPANRLLVYWNGVTCAVTGTNWALNSEGFNKAILHTIGRYAVSSAAPFDGYLSDVYFIDGQALTPSDFGAYDGNYYWTPKAYTGTYGTNGFHLEFEDFSAATAAAIGKDTSGQGNNWTPTGINVTTPANTNSSWDSMTDVPTLTSADVANFCTLNPLRSFVSGSAATFTNGNLNVSIPAVLNPPRNVTSTYDVFSGKWYWEVIAGTVASNFVIGIASKAMDFNATIFVAGSYLYDATTGNKNIGGTASAYGATYTTNDVIGIALDMDAGTLTFYKNGVSQGVAATGLQGLTVTPVIAASGSSAITGTFNFGQRPFRYSNYGTDRPAATFKSLNSFNVAEVTGDIESPDFVWIKSRSGTSSHALFNSVSGVGKYLSSNNTTIETTDVNSLIQFNKNGFLLGNAAIVNTSAATYVASAWKKGVTQGFDIVTFTNTSSSASFNHSLGVTPSMIILKGLGATAANWCVFHKSLVNMTSAYLILNGTATSATLSTAVPAPTSTTFGSSSAAIPASQSSIAYLFADVAGFSKFGSYLSNNAADGPFVYTGFRPRWLMVKRAIVTSGTGGWFMYDAERNTYNVMDKYLFAEATAGDNTLAVFDFTSNGFKIRSNNVHVNTTAGDTYVYMAFAEHPFKYALAR